MNCFHTPVFSPTIHILQPSSAYAPIAISSPTTNTSPTTNAPAPDGLVVNEEAHKIYVLEFKWVSDVVIHTLLIPRNSQSFSYLTATQSLGTLFSDTPWTVEQLSFIAGQKSVNGDFGTTLSRGLASVMLTGLESSMVWVRPYWMSSRTYFGRIGSIDWDLD